MAQHPQAHPISAVHRLLRGGLIWLPALLLAGCFQDVKESTVHPETDTGRVIQHVYALVTWIDAVIFLIVLGLLLWAVFRYRESRFKPGEVPKQVHGNPMLELVWTVIPAVILVFIAVPTWQGIFRAAEPPTTDPVKVEAVGHQWFWEFDYPDKGFVTGNEMHLPLNRPALVHTTSKDVIHSFWVPRLAGKIDAIPGKENLVWFTPEVAGTFYGQCAEFCGTSHANMRMRVVVESEADFDAWVARMKQPQLASTPEAKEGEALFAQKFCVVCHTINGRPDAAGQVGPNLTDLRDRTTIAAGLLDNTAANLSHWIRAPRSIKPGVKMCWPPVDSPEAACGPLPVNEEEAQKIITYLDSPSAGATADYLQKAQGAAGATAQMK